MRALFIFLALILGHCSVLRADNVKNTNMTEKDYKQFIEQHKLGFLDLKQGEIPIGDVAVVQNRVFHASSEGKNQSVPPQIFMSLRVMALPNLFKTSLAELKIKNVFDNNGRDVHADEWKNSLELGGRDENVEFYQTGISVVLKSGTKKEDIKKIIGELTLRLPLGIAKAVFDNTMKGQTEERNGLGITLSHKTDQNFTLTTNGKNELFIRAIAYDNKGKECVPISVTGTTMKVDEEIRNYSFDEDIEKIVVVVASSFVEEKYPFEIDTGN